MTRPTSSEPSYFKKSYQLLSDYFLNSNKKWKAWALFSGCVLSTLAMIGLGFVLGGWFFPFIYAAFIVKDTALLLLGLGAGLLISGAMAGFNYLANYLKNELYVSWRSWLTKKMINQYLSNKTNYLEISRIYNDIDNPEQRIQEDIDKVVESSLDLFLGFIDSFSNLVVYTLLLSLAGGTLSFVLLGSTIVIPGFLVFVALGVGIVTSLIGYFINRSLRESTNEETIAQSNLRADLQHIKMFSEEIAIEHAEQYYQNRLEKEVDELNKKTAKRLSIQNDTTSFNVFNGTFQVIVPIIAAAPLYFADLISLDVFYSVGYYFSMMTRSLNWFINSFETINKFQTSLSRIITLQNALDKNNAGESTRKIIRTVAHHDNTLVVKKLELNLHGSNELVIKGLDLHFTPGVHTLIQAPSGAGKSSLFKAIAGTWLSGEGEIIIPGSLESVYFLPQKPTLPNDTLRKVLAYPDANCSYSDNELISALKAVNMGALADKLDKQVGFKSLGEQQRIAFARVLLRKPDWIFLDEATASLDEEVEEQVYCRLKELLPKTTIISIAHRSTVRRHHDNVVFFKVNDKKEVQVQEEHRLSADSHSASGF
ncbi:ABC transporter ATP-binding protein/permease [Legionella bononiensis]|uniref:ABC transporter ATP-binding protein/permease n=1 Tax=Legionella bononiensis TaxID=2793102 RepID=A0ABS1WG60_9GAMM|nr:ATP-binding cassette domain-containing protein [Legionella bononiensis]MBL7481790.1 ABC transporter ATP-binding protein/permease [Legionella bononiensis]MBL7528339.1 ABC transporter ATP-binding protein/permease [Legionella bononiensis]MBL7564302.1 ABC transporter ATP-binding protein/permease [Legionella bononiensis]